MQVYNTGTYAYTCMCTRTFCSYTITVGLVHMAIRYMHLKALEAFHGVAQHMSSERPTFQSVLTCMVQQVRVQNSALRFGWILEPYAMRTTPRLRDLAHDLVATTW